MHTKNKDINLPIYFILDYYTSTNINMLNAHIIINNINKVWKYILPMELKYYKALPIELKHD